MPENNTNRDANHLRGAGLIALLGFLTAFSPLSIDMYVPSLPALVQSLHTTPQLAQQSMSAFFFGLGFGQFFSGGLSDRYGRLPPLFAGVGLYLLASIACALAPTIHVLIAARVIQGLGVSATAVTSRAVVRDVYSGREAARVMSFVVMIMGVAPMVAPLIGGQILVIAGWRAIFDLMIAIAVLGLVLIRLLLPETNDPSRRGNAGLAERFRDYATLLADPRVRAWLVCGGGMYAALFAYVTGASFVYIDIFGVSEQAFGLYFAINVIGTIGGNYANGRLVGRFGYRQLAGVAVAVGVVSTAVLLGFAVAGAGFFAIITPLFFAVGAAGVIGANTVAGLLNLYPDNAGAGSALFGVFQFGFGAVAVAIEATLYNGTPLAMALVMAGGTLCAFLAWCRLTRLQRAHRAA